VSRNVHLHARDLQVLELLADRRIETLAALHEKLWPGCAKKSAYNRLGQLAAAGYLEHLLRPDPVPRPSHERRPNQHLYVLGPKAPTALRIRNRSTRKLAAASLPAAFVDHQLAINRVGDWLKTRLLGEHEASAGLDSKHRPDAAYQATPDERGRDLVLLEVDLGHYSRARILDKVTGFRQHPNARSILFACPTSERAAEVARWIRDHFGTTLPEQNCQVLSFGEIQRQPGLDPGTNPVPAVDATPGWYAQILGDPGHR
jgi:hypothetical protein